MLSFDQQQSSASCPYCNNAPVTSTFFWYQLVDSATGQPYKGAIVDAVSLPPNAVVLQFRDAVHVKNSNKLTGRDAPDLLVFKNKAAFDRRNNAEGNGKEQPLKSSRNLHGLGESEEDVLIVVVSSSRNEILVSNKKTKKILSYWFLLLDSATGQPYKGTTADFVSLPSGADVAEFRDAVHAKNSNKLAGVDASDLLVFKDKAAFERRNNAEEDGKEPPLVPNESIGVLRSKKDLLLVVVTSPGSSSQTTTDLCLIKEPSRKRKLRSNRLNEILVENAKKSAKAKTDIQTPLFLPCKLPFFNSIRNVTERKGCISFGQANIPSTSLNSLYIRKCYRTIASNILKVNGIHKAIITGTPGIGKSLFLVYLLWRLVKEGKRVLFIYDPFEIYFDGNGGVFSLDINHLPRRYDYSFWNASLWCLFDAKFKKELHLMQIPVSLSTSIVSTSPRREMVNDFCKPPEPQVFYMPTWTEDELEAIASFFPKANNKWRDRFKILGGIPRNVLEATKKSPTAILKAACKNCSLDDCINEIGFDSTITEKSKVVHSLVHMTSIRPYKESTVQYASPTALDIIVQRNRIEVKQKMQSLLASCEGSTLTAALCGYIFELHAIELLEKGGTFAYRKLVGGRSKIQPSEETLHIPPSTKIVFDKVSPKQTRNQLYVPKTKSYTGIDAWIPGIGAFQMTVSQKHDINERAKLDLAMLGTRSSFYFVLCPSNYYSFYSFTKQKPQDMNQFAILIPYPE